MAWTVSAGQYQGQFGMDQICSWTFDRTKYQGPFGMDQMSLGTFWMGPNVLKVLAEESAFLVT